MVDAVDVPGLWLIRRHLILAAVLPLPVLIDRCRHADQPIAVLHVHQEIHRGKKFNGVGRRVGQWFQQPGRDQRGHTMRLTIQPPRRLLRRHAGRELTASQRTCLCWPHQVFAQ